MPLKSLIMFQKQAQEQLGIDPAFGEAGQDAGSESSWFTTIVSFSGRDLRNRPDGASRDIETSSAIWKCPGGAQ